MITYLYMLSMYVYIDDIYILYNYNFNSIKIYNQFIHVLAQYIQMVQLEYLECMMRRQVQCQGLTNNNNNNNEYMEAHYLFIMYACFIFIF